MSPRPTTHMQPLPGCNTVCCDKPFHALPIGDVVAIDPAKVTCGRPK